ncbi:hypothetical protein GYMLUDRAFT_1012933 [Collybiopsis luxurians FD-317 M1]|uniref:BTB domain-containing protein n=1 Tax=Collybiopsis luxurians FD-317 M1 TaxID=944289 RepID=A0A0D0CMN1_9AGAR|nr:hypothetical protein GYMLUDRAFT_1012933 [Collybiopsis luxurians FD-317 M1]
MSSTPPPTFVKFEGPNNDFKFDITLSSPLGRKQSSVFEFHLEKKYLKANSGALPPAKISTDENVVYLSESSATLEILFQFMYPRRYPSINELTFSALILLAKAVEKYEVYSMIYACQVRLQEFLVTESKAVLAFSTKHHYMNLIIQLAPIMVDTPISELANILPSRYFKPWSIYRESWLDAMLSVAKSVSDHSCNNWSLFVKQVLTLPEKPSDLQSANLGSKLFSDYKVKPFASKSKGIFSDVLIPLDQCCQSKAQEWKTKISLQVNDIPPLCIKAAAS